MFGYIKPDVPELKVKENELYRSVYCGLCRCMGRKTTCVSCLTLSYDFVFLALIRVGLLDDTLSLKLGRCIAHPMKKRVYTDKNPSLEYCAGASALLTYGKVRDDIEDSKGVSKLRGHMALPYAKLMLKKARLDAGFEDLESYVNDRLEELHVLETSGAGEFSADAPAEIFGRLLGRVCSFGIEDSAKARIAEQIGFHTGKWIYFVDAADDFQKDMKSGNYNPFAPRIASDHRNETEVLPDRKKPADKDEGSKAQEGAAPYLLNSDRVKVSLAMELRGIEAALNLIDFQCREVENIVKNIIYLGMPECSEKILNNVENSTTEKTV